ncbi:hypothetical protein SPRG_20878 [Saprolegnia parasitica CBS 223.65]|uniref:HTH La-type RNA-binding domain-containing protein n=1 Tax=Saprolegnia parasitica (strain CBS 223.65) TaxID=695850 RepID=A0A067BXH1_SAPPC|nr:hypothetical protein SPRG_20878 [Saprolegnia parasitica CBS 223.65]KDO23189.1 hypothetical protein SPRG_20878 [Saprolegnia parasitica CBS 223.65]|eukprot:XP_012206161.1 hypothetical protein SPRG_20878 [Saprolegnia parasitica CBS 223.65]
MSATQEAQLVGAALKDALQSQVEFYFSKANLATDSYLVSQMNAQMFVPIDTILGFAKIKALSDDAALLIDAIKDSQIVVLNDEKNAIKPNIKSERNTIILREIPSATAPAEVEAIFAGCGAVTSVRSDVGDTWFVTMATEEEAVNTLLALRNKTFNNAPIKARLKSENLFKSFFPQSTPSVDAAASPVTTSAYSKESAKPKSERQPILNAVNFPPLPTNVGGAAITQAYSHEDIMEIVKHMDEADCVLPEGKMDFEAHAAALTPDAHPDLLRNQRTYSIEKSARGAPPGPPDPSKTKKARELRQQAQEKAVEEGKPIVAAVKEKPASGYAAALINGAAAAAVKKEEAPKKKEVESPKKAAPVKKAVVVEAKKEVKEVPVVAPTGAWGARSFLDIVKEPKKAEAEE